MEGIGEIKSVARICANCGAPIEEYGKRCRTCRYITDNPATWTEYWDYRNAIKSIDDELDFADAALSLQKLQNKTIDVYFALLKCEYGIYYVMDYNKKAIPNIFKLNWDDDVDLSKSENYQQIQKCLAQNEYSNAKKQYFEDEIQKIETLINDTKNQIKSIQENGDGMHDVFICARITKRDDDGNIIGRQEEADEVYSKGGLYSQLKDSGLKVFWCENEIDEAKKRGDANIDSIIYSALLKSRCMLIVSSSIENINSSWVRSEWSRWAFIGKYVRNMPERRIFAYYLKNLDRSHSGGAAHFPQKYMDLFDKTNYIYHKDKNEWSILKNIIVRFCADYAQTHEQMIRSSRNLNYKGQLEKIEKLIQRGDFSHSLDNCVQYMKKLKIEYGTKLDKDRKSERDIFVSCFIRSLTKCKNNTQLSKFTYKTEKNEKKCHRGLSEFMIDFCSYISYGGYDKYCSLNLNERQLFVEYIDKAGGYDYLKKG